MARYGSSGRSAVCDAAIATLAHRRNVIEREERVDLEVGERLQLVIAAHHERRIGQRIAAVEHRVGDRDGKISGRKAVYEIAKIEEAGDLFDSDRRVAIRGATSTL